MQEAQFVLCTITICLYYMREWFCPRLTFRGCTPWKIILFALLNAYERIIEYVASFVDFLEIHASDIINIFFSRISSSALLCGLVSLVRKRS